MSKRNRIVAIIAAVLVIAIVVGVYFLTKPKTEQPQAADDPTTSSSTSVASTSLAPSTSSSSLKCTTTTEGFTPVRYTIEGSLSVDEKVLSLGQDEDGSIAAPPPAEKRTASWWNEGPKPGQAGKAVLSIHTYRNGGALGNELYDGGKSQLKAGDVVKLYGENGEVACYEFTEAKKIMVEDYDENSDVMVDFDGDSELAIIICWDFDKTAEDKGEDPWKSRVFFYGKLF